MHFTSASDASDSDGEDDDDQSDASADDKSTIENPTSSPPGYIHKHMHVYISYLDLYLTNGQLHSLFFILLHLL